MFGFWSRKKRIRKILKGIDSINTHKATQHSTKLVSFLEELTILKYVKNIQLSRLHSLNKVDIQKIQLSLSLDMFQLENSTITDTQFGNKNLFEFRNLNIKQNTFTNSEFLNGTFTHVYFLESILRNSLFTNISFTDTQFDHVKMWDSVFSNCVFNNPIRVNIKNQSIESLNMMVASGFICSRLQNVVFENVQFSGIDFTGTGLIDCKFINVNGLKPKDFYYVKTLYKTVLPDEIDADIREKHSHLFEKPVK